MESNKNDFTRGNILKKMLKFMVPVLGALILQAMYGAVDILVVGWFGTTAGISGVSTGSNIVNLVVFTVTGLSMGITVLIGRYIGEKEDQKAGKVIGGAVWFFAVLSVILAAVLLIFARPLAILMQAPEEALDLTVTYVRICGGGIFFIVAYNVISSIFRGMGNSRLPLIFVAIACGVNIVGDLFFVAILDMNVAGAALATVLAQAVSVVLSLAIIRRQKLPFTMTLKDIGINPEIWKFVKVGAPIAFQEILTQLSFLALCAFINRLGLEASSGYGVANKIVSFIGYFNGHSQTMFVMLQGLCQTFLVRLPVSYLFVMLQGLCQTFLVRLPVSYFMSIQENASLTWIGTAAPLATVFGIVLNTVYFIWYYRCVICRAGRK